MRAILKEVPAPLRADLDRLCGVIAARGPMAVAFSGGVDSGLLAYVAHRVLGERMTCIVGVSASLAASEERGAIAFLERHGIPYARVETREMDDPAYRANGPDRCYLCKRELFARIASSPHAARFPRIAYGANVDDLSDFRPGARAASERSVVAPLAEADFDKARIRETARALGLALWDKPAAPCLASRVPYFAAVTPENLRRIERAEGALDALGFASRRVRDHGALARVELPLAEHRRARSAEIWREIENRLRAAGYERVELAPDGLRSGRLNEALRAGDA
jgi:uncharacterized protein